MLKLLATSMLVMNISCTSGIIPMLSLRAWGCAQPGAAWGVRKHTFGAWEHRCISGPSYAAPYVPCCWLATAVPHTKGVAALCLPSCRADCCKGTAWGPMPGAAEAAAQPAQASNQIGRLLSQRPCGRVRPRSG